MHHLITHLSHCPFHQPQPEPIYCTHSHTQSSHTPWTAGDSRALITRGVAITLPATMMMLAPVRLRSTIANVSRHPPPSHPAATSLRTARTVIVAQQSPPRPLAVMAIAAAIPASWASPVIRAAGRIWGIRTSRALAVAAAEAAWVAAAPVAWQVPPALAAQAAIAVVVAAGAMSGEIGSVMHRGKLQWVLLLLAWHKHNQDSPPVRRSSVMS